MHGLAEHALPVRAPRGASQRGRLRRVRRRSSRSRPDRAAHRTRSVTSARAAWPASSTRCTPSRERVAADHPGLPVFALGHSWGSFILYRYVQQYGAELAGALFTGTTRAVPGVEATRERQREVRTGAHSLRLAVARRRRGRCVHRGSVVRLRVGTAAAARRRRRRRPTSRPGDDATIPRDLPGPRVQRCRRSDRGRGRRPGARRPLPQPGSRRRVVPGLSRCPPRAVQRDEPGRGRRPTSSPGSTGTA